MNEHACAATRSESRRLLVATVMALAMSLLTLWPGTARAGACTVASGVAQFNPPLTQLVAKGVGTVAWDGTATVGPFNCSFSSGGGSYAWNSASVGGLVPTGANGFDVGYVAVPSISGLNVTAGNCTVTPQTSSGSGGAVPGVTVSASGAASCSFSYTVHFALQQTAATWANPVIPSTTPFGSAGGGADTVAFSAGGIAANAVASTCALTVSPTTVTLPTVSATSLATVGTTAGTTPFAVTLQNCNTPGLAAYLTFYFTQGAAPSYIANTGTASDVQLLIADSGGNPVRGDGTPVLMTSALSTGTNTATYFTKYVRATSTGNVSGSVQAIVSFNVTYQ